MKKTELLAPAGDFSCLSAALNAGADAVYLAGKSFGARAFAGNFEKEELLEALDYAHALSRRIYLTVNTLIKESEYADVVNYLTPYYEHGLDGVILQDFGLILLLSQEFPHLELHASTQMTVNNYRSAAFLKQKGIVRVVPSRELSLTELQEIKTKAGVEVETFIHGAMCYGYSGQCLFSSFLGGRSGNRGRCAQPCRLPYRISLDGSANGKELYPLSLKDLCSLPHIYELLDAGLDSFKIEGRMKSAEYVAGVTSVYRKYMDLYAAGERTKIAEQDLELLSRLYIRSKMEDGYLKKHNSKDMISLYSPSYQGCDEKVIAALKQKFCHGFPKLPIRGTLTLSCDKPAALTAEYQGHSVVCYGEIVQAAQNRPLMKEDVLKQLGKTGDSPFKWEQLSVELEDAVFMPVKQINELRRNTLEELKTKLLLPYQRTKALVQPEKMQKITDAKDTFSIGKAADCKSLFRVAVYDEKQLQSLLHLEAKNALERIYVPADLFYLKKVHALDILAKAHKENIQIYLSMPRILRRRDEEYLSVIKELLPLFDGIRVQNLETLYFLQEEGYAGASIADTMLYAWNQSAVAFLKKECSEFTYPLELTGREIMDLQDTSGEYVVYGRTKMMVSANCIRKTSEACKHNSNSFAQTITDRYRKKLPVYANCVHCYNEILNAVGMSLHKELPQLQKRGFYKFRLEFTTEEPKQLQKILEYFIQKSKDPEWKETFPIKEYTLGHYKEGAI